MDKNKYKREKRLDFVFQCADAFIRQAEWRGIEIPSAVKDVYLTERIILPELIHLILEYGVIE